MAFRVLVGMLQGLHSCKNLIENQCRPSKALLSFITFFPGFRFASPWANFSARLRRLVHRSIEDFYDGE